MKKPLFEKIKDVFESNSLSLDKESRTTTHSNFNKRLFISCDFETPYQLRKYFHRPHTYSYNLVTRINLTELAFNESCSNVWTKSIHGDSLSIEIKYNSEDSTVRILACGPLSGYAVLWSGRIGDLIRYFKDHHEQPVNHDTYRLSFKGRKTGSIGVTCNINLELSIPLYYSLNNKIQEYLYEVGYDHISELKETIISQNKDSDYIKEL